MQRGALLSVVNVAVAAGALVIWFRYPRYAYYAIYALFAWFLVSFSLTWAFRGNPGPVGPAASAAGGGPSGVGAHSSNGPPAPAGPPIASSEDGTTVPFCIYCATDLPPDVGRCPACGHLVLALS